MVLWNMYHMSNMSFVRTSPHLNISPKCECREKLNNCNCNFITHKNLKTYHSRWNSRIMINQHNNHATQMNTHQVNYRLLFSLIILSFFTISMLTVIVFLIFFSLLPYHIVIPHGKPNPE